MIKDLFFFKDKKGYKAVWERIKKTGSSDFTILPFSEKDPYIFFGISNYAGINSWTEFGFDDNLFRDFWLEHYAGLVGEVRLGLKGTAGPAVADNQYFIFGLVRKLGNCYYARKIIEGLFSENMPSRIFMQYPIGHDMFSRSVVLFSARYGKAVEKI